MEWEKEIEKIVHQQMQDPENPEAGRTKENSKIYQHAVADLKKEAEK